MSDKVKVAVDAMGGDYGPSEIVKGAVDAARETQRLQIFLLGDEEKIKKELEQIDSSLVPQDRIEIIPTTQVIETGEAPVNAIRTKKDSSMVRGMKMVHNQEADALVSAGSSGALLVGGQIIVGRIRGIERSPLAPVLPSAKGPFLLVDAGANVDARASQLVQFAQMGSIYMEGVVGIPDPRVALFNIGAEEEKGNAVVKEAYSLLKNLDGIHFVGNIEGRDIPEGEADVVVCDAFTGNAILKLYEGTGEMVYREIKEVFNKNLRTKIGALLLEKNLRSSLKKFDMSRYGGAPLLGLKGLVVKSHGNAKALAVQHTIQQCVQFKDSDINGQFREKMHLDEKAMGGINHG